LTVTLPLPFRNSRELAHGNSLLVEPCVALEVVGIDLAPDLYDGWRRRVERVAAALGWPAPALAAVVAGPLHTLSFSAPANQLQTAREANEWALCASVVERDPCHWGALRDSAAEADEGKALERLRQLGVAEARSARTA
jgi:cyanophycin synthetase